MPNMLNWDAILLTNHKILHIAARMLITTVCVLLLRCYDKLAKNYWEHGEIDSINTDRLLFHQHHLRAEAVQSAGLHSSSDHRQQHSFPVSLYLHTCHTCQVCLVLNHDYVSVTNSLQV